MPYKKYSNQKRNSLINYYKNRKKRLKYQRIYDKKHIQKKRDFDIKRRKNKDFNRISNIREYSKKYYFNVLFSKYKGCELCNSVKKLELHHKKYTKNIKDIMLLCQKCHKKLHRKNFV
jgi:hypothetical protein